MKFGAEGGSRTHTTLRSTDFKTHEPFLPKLSVPIVRLNEFLPDTQAIGQGVVVLQPGWEQVLENNKQAFALEFVQRSRFTTAFPTAMTPAQFVDQLFIKTRVSPSPTDRNAAIAEFGSATNTSDMAARSRALRDVAENGTLAQQEFNRAFVLMQYFGYLRRNPNDPQDTDYTGYDFWLTKLNQFNGNFQNAEMVKAFIVSSEYRQRFGPPFTITTPNQPPTVSAGSDQTITLPNTARLNGAVTDDGLPNGTLIMSWSKVSGPGTVIFSNASSPATSATFNTAGTYVLRLSGNDTAFARSADVTITVTPDPTPPPPDPSTVAPPLDATVPTSIGTGTQFLYTGSNPIQTRVAPGTIVQARAAVVRGRVLDRSGSPLPNVKITIRDHREFGQTLSRVDGKFDMAVNGGGLLTVSYDKVGFAPAQRQMFDPQQDYGIYPDVVMMGYDSQVTLVDLSASIPIQVARASVITDADGTRQETLFFPQGTNATMVMPDGSMRALTTLHVRASEFTVGPMGSAEYPV
jgi:hypothetical protein